MNPQCETTSGQSHDEQQSVRQPYVKPEIESLGGTLATLLASGCQSCQICGDPTSPDNTL